MTRTTTTDAHRTTLKAMGATLSVVTMLALAGCASGGGKTEYIEVSDHAVHLLTIENDKVSWSMFDESNCKTPKSMPGYELSKDRTQMFPEGRPAESQPVTFTDEAMTTNGVSYPATHTGAGEANKAKLDAWVASNCTDNLD